MKNSKIVLSLAFLSAILFGCQKESTLTSELNSTSQPYVKTVIRFTIGENSYEMSSVREETINQTGNGCGAGCCGGNSCNDLTNNDYTADWTRFSGGNLLTVIRQDDARDPAFRLSLLGTIDLNGSSYPANIANASITLNDFNGAFIQPTDDPAYSTGALTFEGDQDAVNLTITTRNGNVVEGVFSGILKMANGSTLEIRDGTFTAQLKGL